jgi:hypothetical protein
MHNQIMTSPVIIKFKKKKILQVYSNPLKNYEFSKMGFKNYKLIFYL